MGGQVLWTGWYLRTCLVPASAALLAQDSQDQASHGVLHSTKVQHTSANIAYVVQEYLQQTSAVACVVCMLTYYRFSMCYRKAQSHANLLGLLEVGEVRAACSKAELKG